ncbi:MAG TPA: hypothetical protein VH163_07720, partial [Gemmatimonadales bacterium]|nr:hypothetical protein [Gemmatimonadales bacterium]
PLFVRAGAILPKIPEDVMTLVPRLDDRRVYELYPGPANSIVDFEGRRLAASASGLRITGKPARITIVWRFQGPKTVRLNGKPIVVTGRDDSVQVTFEHRGQSALVW